MKAIALIMSLFIFGSSVKGTPLTEVVISVIGTMDCEHESESKTCHGDGQESENCCGDMGCECTCCVHIMILTSVIDFKFIQESFADTNYPFAWDYTRDYLNTIFHPPALG